MTTPRPDDAPSRVLLVVAGPGRSGTSLFTGLAGELGFHIPQPEVKADDTNPRGFGEPRWAVDFHEEVLTTLGSGREDARPAAWEVTAQALERPRLRARLTDWLDAQLAVSDRVVVKDPRVTWFLDLYDEVARSLDARQHVVSLVRHPAASIKSRQVAYGSGSPDVTRLAGWLNMSLFLEQRTRGRDRALVGYDDLVEDWTTALAGVERRAHVDLFGHASDQQRAAAAALVDPALRRSAPDWSALDVPPALADLADRAFDALRAVATDAATDTDAEAARGAVDAVREEYVATYATAEALTRSTVRAARVKERRAARREAAAADQTGPASPAGPPVLRRAVGGIVRRVRGS